MTETAKKNDNLKVNLSEFFSRVKMPPTMKAYAVATLTGELKPDEENERTLMKTLKSCMEKFSLDESSKLDIKIVQKPNKKEPGKFFYILQGFGPEGDISGFAEVELFNEYCALNTEYAIFKGTYKSFKGERGDNRVSNLNGELSLPPAVI